jgi:hypothetical protein
MRTQDTGDDKKRPPRKAGRPPISDLRPPLPVNLDELLSRDKNDRLPTLIGPRARSGRDNPPSESV